MAEIFQFPGSELTMLDVSPNEVLQAALNADLPEVLVVGRCQDGSNYFASTTGNKGRLLFLIESFKFKLMNGDLDTE